MTPRRRVIAIGVPAGAAALGLAVWLIVARTSRSWSSGGSPGEGPGRRA